MSYGHAKTLHADYPAYEARRGRELAAEGEQARRERQGRQEPEREDRARGQKSGPEGSPR